MAAYLEDIEAGLRESGRDGEATITSGGGLSLANRVYRSMADTLPFPELRVTVNVTDTMTSGTGSYEMPIKPVFMNIRAM